jgi:hypothetical protein
MHIVEIPGTKFLFKKFALLDVINQMMASPYFNRMDFKSRYDGINFCELNSGLW